MITMCMWCGHELQPGERDRCLECEALDTPRPADVPNLTYDSEGHPIDLHPKKEKDVIH